MDETGRELAFVDQLLVTAAETARCVLALDALGLGPVER